MVEGVENHQSGESVAVPSSVAGPAVAVAKEAVVRGCLSAGRGNRMEQGRRVPDHDEVEVVTTMGGSGLGACCGGLVALGGIETAGDVVGQSVVGYGQVSTKALVGSQQGQDQDRRLGPGHMEISAAVGRRGRATTSGALVEVAARKVVYARHGDHAHALPGRVREVPKIGRAHV